MANVQVKAPDLERQARYLLSIACLVKNAERHDELQLQAERLLSEAQTIREKRP
jgi:hypothetical protein